MSQDELHKGEAAQAWDTYWEGAGDSSAFTSGGAGHPGFQAFWSDAFGEYFKQHPGARTLDIGTGSGAVIEYLSLVPGAQLDKVSCVDIAEDAVNGVQDRFPAVTGVVADANQIPLEPGSFDLVTSQFGVEYAGPGAIDEAIRLLAPGGHLIFLLHFQGGALHQSCQATLDALQRVQKVDFFALTTAFLTAGFAAVRGADRGPYDSAAKQLNPAIKELESILSQHGEGVADRTIEYLYSTLQNIHSRIEHYDADEVLNWLAAMEQELPKYLQRMESMHRSVLNKAAIEGIRTMLANKGLPQNQAQPLLFEGDPLPFAWVLQASNAQA